ncbi:alpha/beta hydrolase [Actinomadura madurae]|uniref:alpha/beta fold hydrolase n=1 Tax=Actinomadura madurae TaxID=1993 RepID=UPI0020D24060|nr:alpha/beta hydrolase [Actinomadura madurae]
MSETRFLDLPGGRLAYDDTGDGPLVVCLPSMLDLRSQYRFLRPLLLQAGYRVVTVDQRGMGETSATWPEYGSTPLAHDLMALLRHLDAGRRWSTGARTAPRQGCGSRPRRRNWSAGSCWRPRSSGTARPGSRRS